MDCPVEPNPEQQYLHLGMEPPPSLRVSYAYFPAARLQTMDRRDQDLLDKQMRRLAPMPRNDGAMILALVAVFLAGMTLGAAMFAHKSQPTRFTSNDAMAELSPPGTALPFAR
jgi:hypothetical protein